ncbi:RHS repeat-associated core domain-containing protein [Flavobacterium sp. MMLR14_040]|uniref:RHS repeat-associated core domain-containing protein n=1 Tax=Flavobacterium sp. MMLR14_040 TaxID=3093843 RepID=UPI0029904ACF|nr:RHS repeat-associated core domain-containing protein [Flavobacterium sp. MMLR14_040]MDW8852405.1 RHS repeat-associated core domain-containing protein [Flavobacterium sp. MMLR14_040]
MKTSRYWRGFLCYDELGNLVWETDYDIYGDLRNLKGDRDFIPFRQLGQYEDVETRLYYNRHRYYSPETGGYISQDPIRLFGGSKLYGYVHNPNGFVDIFGLNKCTISAGDGVTHDIVATIKRSDYPETTKHIEEAIAKGHPEIVTIDRLTAGANRKASLDGIPTKKGFDRDEWPMAMFKEGGSGASVKYINPSDNRGAGSAIGNALSEYDPGTLVKINIID